MSKPQRAGSSTDITTDWVNRAFAAGRTGLPVVIRMSAVPAGAGRGIVGEILRCHLTYAAEVADAPSSVIVKLPGREPSSRTMSRRLGLHAREYAFYTRLGNDVPVRTPRVYYADYDPQTDDLVVVQEDLAGMVQVDPVTGATPAQAHAALRGLAKLHAQFIGRTRDERLAAEAWKQRTRRQYLLLQALYLWYLPQVLRRFEEYFSPRLHRIALELGCVLAAYQRRSFSATPLTFIHGDFRLDNLFFDSRDPAGMTVIDWQMCTIAPGMRDMAYFLAWNVEPEVRRSIEREVVEKYGAVMARAGCDLAFDVWWHAYRMQILGNLLHAILICGNFKNAPGPTRQLARTFLYRILTAIEDLNVAELLPEFDTKGGARMFWLGFHGVARALTAKHREG